MYNHPPEGGAKLNEMKKLDYCPECLIGLNSRESEMGFCQNCKHHWDDDDINDSNECCDDCGSVYLTENQIAELAQIGNNYLYLDEMDNGRISYIGIMEILIKYEEFRKTDG